MNISTSGPETELKYVTMQCLRHGEVRHPHTTLTSLRMARSAVGAVNMALTPCWLIMRKYAPASGVPTGLPYTHTHTHTHTHVMAQVQSSNSKQFPPGTITAIPYSYLKYQAETHTHTHTHTHTLTHARIIHECTS
jgi:hypothetical protein